MHIAANTFFLWPGHTGDGVPCKKLAVRSSGGVLVKVRRDDLIILLEHPARHSVKKSQKTGTLTFIIP
jgi:hypothetical protein